MQIKYETYVDWQEETFSGTNCEFINHLAVGSIGCLGCDHFIFDNYEDQIVECNFPVQVGESVFIPITINDSDSILPNIDLPKINIIGKYEEVKCIPETKEETNENN
jgi:hypothetical protein